MRKIIFLFFTMFLSMIGRAQNVDDVTVVVSGSASTKEEAINLALRSAVEQAYGVFVSANTSIFNDELVRDEIATVTSGNIKSYSELDSSILPNGLYNVTLKAVVSTQKLVSFAKSKGAACEFAGATLMANRKLWQLNKINTQKAFDNLLVQLESIAPSMFDYRLDVSSRLTGSSCLISFYVSIESNENTEIFVNLLTSTLNALKLSSKECDDMRMLLDEDAYKLYTNSDLLGEPASDYPYADNVISFSCPFPIYRFLNIIEEARNNWVVESNLGDKYSPKNLGCKIDDELQGWYSVGEADSPIDEQPCWKEIAFGPSFNRSGEVEHNKIIIPKFSSEDALRPIFKSKKKQQEPVEHNSITIARGAFTIRVPIDKVDQLSGFEIHPKHDLTKFPELAYDWIDSEFGSSFFNEWDRMSDVRDAIFADIEHHMDSLKTAGKLIEAYEYRHDVLSGCPQKYLVDCRLVAIDKIPYLLVFGIYTQDYPLSTENLLGRVSGCLSVEECYYDDDYQKHEICFFDETKVGINGEDIDDCLNQRVQSLRDLFNDGKCSLYNCISRLPSKHIGDYRYGDKEDYDIFSIVLVDLLNFHYDSLYDEEESYEEDYYKDMLEYVQSYNY